MGVWVKLLYPSETGAVPQLDVISNRYQLHLSRPVCWHKQQMKTSKYQVSPGILYIIHRQSELPINTLQYVISLTT